MFLFSSEDLVLGEGVCINEIHFPFVFFIDGLRLCI